MADILPKIQSRHNYYSPNGVPLGGGMVGRAVPASRPSHRRKLRLQNSRYTSFGGIISGGVSPTKIFGMLSAAQEVPPKFQRLLLRCRKSRYFPIINFFNRYLAEPAPISGIWFLSDIWFLLFGLVFGLFMACRIYCPCRTCRTCSCARRYMTMIMKPVRARS